MFVNVLHKIERTLRISITQVIAELVFSYFLPPFSSSSPSSSFSPPSVFPLFLFYAFMASGGDRLLISPDGLLSLWDVMESFRCVSRIVHRFSILSQSSTIPFFLSFSLAFSLFLSSAAGGVGEGATDWSTPPSSTTCFPQRTRVCVGSKLGGTNRENTRENTEDEEKDEGGFFLFQERSFEYEYALIDS